MGLRMKKFNIFGVHWKIQILGVGVTNTEGGLPKKRELGQFVDLRGGAWQERGGGIFEGGWYLNAHCRCYLYLLRVHMNRLNHILNVKVLIWEIGIFHFVLENV